MKRPAAASASVKRRKLEELPGKLPVTTLCGFLGAGKTTLLKHILETKHTERDGGFRCAVIVNDVAELNIDKSLIDQSNLVQSDDVIALQNGCVCCTLQNDLVTQIMELAKKKTFNYMIIEASGVSEPSQIAKLFADCEEDHDHTKEHEHKDVLSECARLDTCVTVVDSADFFNKLTIIKPGPKQESFPQLLVEQIEYANVVVLNKSDLVSKAQLDKVSEQLYILNPKAKLFEARNSRVPVLEVVDTGMYKAEDFAGFQTAFDKVEEGEMKDCCMASLAAGELPCCRSKRTTDSGKSKVVLAHNRPSKPDSSGNSLKPRHASRFGISSFLYQARRPFHPERFDKDFIEKYFIHQPQNEDAGDEDEKAGMDMKRRTKAAEQKQRKQKELLVKRQQEKANEKRDLRTKDLGDIVRSKGFLWLANRHDLTGMMSQAGSVTRIEFPGSWVVLEAKAWEGTEKEIAAARCNWVPPWGDRRQDLVFIGKDLQHETIQKTLDSCLLTDEEMYMGVDGWKATMGDALLDHALGSDDPDE
jgi:G3E family GTPase